MSGRPPPACSTSFSAARKNKVLELMSDSTQFSRRAFGRAAAAATALSYSRVLGANDRVRMGYIGLGNRGDQVHDAFLEHGDQQTVAVCDLREDYMDNAVNKSRETPTRY